MPAPADTHANDGEHIFLYRSTDNAGNTEATEICGVGIDTVGPVCGALKNATAGAGKSAIVRFKAADVTSGVAVATVRIETRAGRVVHTLVARSGDWSMDPAPAYPLAALHLQAQARTVPRGGARRRPRRQPANQDRPRLAARGA